MNRKSKSRSERDAAKIAKAASVSSEAAAACERAISALEPFASDEGQIAGLISKIRAVAEGGKVSTSQPDGWFGDVEKEFADELAAATVEVQKMDSSDPGFAAARKRLQKLQGAWQDGHSAGYARAEEMRKLDASGKAPATDGLAAKADRILKADPAIPYDKLREQFTREEQAAYLESVRGRAV